MNIKIDRTIIQDLVVVFVALCVVGVAGTGIVSAQQNQDLDVTLDIPDEATAGEETTLSASVSTPDIVGDHQNDLTITFSADGEQIASETVTVADGETTEVEVTHTFEEAGDKDIEAEATVTLGGQDFSGSDSATLTVTEPPTSIDGDLSLTLNTPESPQVDEETTTTVESEIPSLTGAETGELTLTLLVDGEETASKTITVSGEETTETDFTTVFESSGETTVTAEGELTVGEQTVTQSVSRTVDVSEAPTETISVEGAAFAVPKSLEDEVADYREDVPEELDSQAFILATQDELYLVFTQQEPTKGVASVEGSGLDRDLSTENLTYGVIAATSTSFETTGTEVSVQEVAANSEQYQLELVRINSHFRRVSTLTDPDEGEDFTLSTTSGILVENPQTAVSLFNNIGGNARTLSQETSTDNIDTILNDPSGPHLHTFSFETKFWTDAEATVDAIVLDPQSTAQRFIDEYDQAGVAHAEDGEPILYVVKEDFGPQQMDNVADIKSQSDSLDGEVVETEVRLYQEKVSVQETLEHNTGCNEDRLEIQTPGGPACINIVQDNLVNGGIAWNSIPQSRDDALLVMGISSRHQDTPEEFEEGRYRIKGEVVSTSRLDNPVPEGSMLVIYDIERVGDIDYDAVEEEARSLIEARTEQLTTRLRQQVGGDDVELVTGRASQTIQTATPGEPATVSFSQSSRSSVAVQQVSIGVSSEVQNLQVDVSDVASLPGNVGQPPGQSIRTLNISTSAADDTISEASFQIRIASAAISDGSVTVYRYDNEEWTPLETTVVEETDTELVLKVKTPGFSYFAVTTQPGDSQTDTGDGGQDDGSDTDNGGQDDGSASDDTPSSEEEQSSDSQSGSDGTSGTETPGGSGPGFTILTVLTAFILFVGWKRRR